MKAPGRGLSRMTSAVRRGRLEPQNRDVPRTPPKVGHSWPRSSAAFSIGASVSRFCGSSRNVPVLGFGSGVFPYPAPIGPRRRSLRAARPQGPEGGQPSSNFSFVAAAIVGGIRKLLRNATTTTRDKFSSVSRLLRRNARHWICFPGSSQNSALKPIGISTGTGVRRRMKVDSMASESISPSKENVRARIHRS